MYFFNEHDQLYGSKRQASFFADADSDIENLPCSTAPGVKQGDDDVSCQPVAPGSKCFSIGSGSTYYLNSTDQWVKA